MVSLKALRMTLAWAFVATVIVSVYPTFNAIYLLHASYAVVNQIDVVQANMSLLDSGSVNARISVAFTIDNPTTINLSLSYSKVIGYVYDDPDARDQAHDWKFYDNALMRKETATTHNPRRALDGLANITVTVEIGGITEILAIEPPKYWELVFVLQFPDAPLLGNRAILYRYITADTSF